MELVERMKADLISLGVNQGDDLLVHSALSTLGRLTDKAMWVTKTLLEILGDEGTLLMPALSYESVTTEDPVYSASETPSCVGGLSEYFRQQPGVLRSMHPTHSVCATGARAAFYLEGHDLDRTPVGENSPFRKLKERGGKILFLGCTLDSNTSMHGVEELSVPEYLFDEDIEYSLTSIKGETYRKAYTPHNFKTYKQRYDRVEQVLEAGDYSAGKILEAGAYLLKAAPLWEKAHEKLLENPLFFVDREEE